MGVPSCLHVVETTNSDITVHVHKCIDGRQALPSGRLPADCLLNRLSNMVWARLRKNVGHGYVMTDTSTSTAMCIVVMSCTQYQYIVIIVLFLPHSDDYDYDDQRWQWS